MWEQSVGTEVAGDSDLGSWGSVPTPLDQFDRVRDKRMAGIPAILLNNLASIRGQNFPLEI